MDFAYIVLQQLCSESKIKVEQLEWNMWREPYYVVIIIKSWMTVISTRTKDFPYIWLTKLYFHTYIFFCMEFETTISATTFMN